MKPLEGINVLDFSQFLSGPSAALRLADLGANVTKIENPAGGDICRSLYLSEWQIDGESALFHAINRNKKVLPSISKKVRRGQRCARLLSRPMLSYSTIVQG